MRRLFLAAILASGVVWGYGQAFGLIDVGHGCPHAERAPVPGE